MQGRMTLDQAGGGASGRAGLDEIGQAGRAWSVPHVGCSLVGCGAAAGGSYCGMDYDRGWGCGRWRQFFELTCCPSAPSTDFKFCRMGSAGRGRASCTIPTLRPHGVVQDRARDAELEGCSASPWPCASRIKGDERLAIGRAHFGSFLALSTHFTLLVNGRAWRFVCHVLIPRIPRNVSHSDA